VFVVLILEKTNVTNPFADAKPMTGVPRERFPLRRSMKLFKDDQFIPGLRLQDHAHLSAPRENDHPRGGSLHPVTHWCGCRRDAEHPNESPLRDHWDADAEATRYRPRQHNPRVQFVADLATNRGA